MAIYKITSKAITTTERTYEIDGKSEKEALENYATNEWDKVHPQDAKTTNHTELIIEAITH